MSSEYAQRPLGKAASLAVNEKVSTPKGALSKTAVKASVLARGSRGPAVVKASEYHQTPTRHPQLLKEGTGKAYTPAKPMGLDKAVGMVVGVKPSTALKAAEHPLRFAAANRKAFEKSGYTKAPITPAGLIQAAGMSQIGKRGAQVAAEEATGLTRLGVGHGGAPKLPKAQQKALQIVREGVPIADRIAAASPKEAASLKAAAKYVHDVQGMPRIRPEHGELVHAYEKSLTQTPQETLRGTLKGARAVRGKQEAGYSTERSTRFANASKFLNDPTLNPEQRIALAKNELKGELPKIDFQGMKVLDETAVGKLQEHILDHPHLLPGQKIRAADALSNALAGKVPTNSELTLLEHVFGKETANGIGQIAVHPYRDLILSALNVPRSLMASFDVSAPARQGLVALTRHPVLSARNFKPMVKALRSEDYFQNDMIGGIESRPTYPMMLEAKLAITKLGSDVGAREERFPSDLAEKIPVVGRGVRGSGRAYNGYLDKTRADIFDYHIRRAQAVGVNVQDEKFLKALGSLINNSTGRGDLSKFQGAANILNTFFFSPRLLASRLNIIAAPVKYAHADPYVRTEAIRTWLTLAGTITSIIGLASRIPGVTVVSDPRNPDWGKIKHGNTRIDLAGGFQQPLRLFAQLATGTAISSTTGNALNLTANGFGKPTRLDLLLRFFEGKESPIASLTTDWLRNSDQIGQKFSWKGEVGQRVIPLLAQDSYSVYQDQHGGMNGIAAAFVGYGIGSVGLGLQTYGPPVSKGRQSPASSDPYGSNQSSGGSDYAQQSGSSGSDYAQP